MSPVPFDYRDELRRSRGYPAQTPPETEREDRIAKLQDSIERYDLDAVLLHASGREPDVVRHLSGFVHNIADSDALFLCPEVGVPVLFIDQAWNLEQAETMTWIDDVRVLGSGGSETAIHSLTEAFVEMDLDSGTIGINHTDIPAEFVMGLSDYPVTLKPAMEVWHDYVNSPTEYDIEMVSRTAAIADEGFAAVKAACQPGRTEREACFAGTERMAELGSEFIHSHCADTHVNTGSFSDGIVNLRPHLFTNNRLHSGQMFWVDLSAHYEGYYIDCCRTISLGEPSDEQAEIYDVTREMYETMATTLKPGITGGELWQVGHEIADSHGYGDSINQFGLGHASGITTGAPPYVVDGESREIPAGCLFNIEPGIFRPGTGSACIENTFHVGTEDTRPLNQWPIDLQVT